MNIPLCVKDSSVRILFTEGRDRRMMEAAIRLYNEQILRCCMEIPGSYMSRQRHMVFLSPEFRL